MSNLTIPKTISSNSTKVALIDGDIIAYRVGFACQKTYYIVDGKQYNGKKELYAAYSKDSDVIKNEEYIDITEADAPEWVLHSVNVLINSILEATDAGSYKVFLTGEGNFREQVAVTAPYKGNRTAAKPLHYELIRKFLVGRHGAVVIEGAEADDALAMEQWKDYAYYEDDYFRLGKCQKHGFEFPPKKENLKHITNTVIASLDKDLKMVPGWHYDFVKEKLEWVDEMTGMKNFYRQMLTGDTTDNIVGLKGIGPVKADKILEGCETEQEMFEATYCAYCEHLGEAADDRMAENGALLWMKRSPDSVPFEEIDSEPVVAIHG